MPPGRHERIADRGLTTRWSRRRDGGSAAAQRESLGRCNERLRAVDNDDRGGFLAQPMVAVNPRQRGLVSSPFRAFRAFVARVLGAGYVTRMLLQRSLQVGSIAIYGPPAFRERVAAALRLMAAGAPEALSMCERFVDTVVMSRHSGVTSHRRPAIVLLGRWVTTVSPSYLASALAHEAFHCSQYWSHRDRQPKTTVPIAIYSGAAAEQRCLDFQVAVLTQLGGSEAELSHLSASMATEWWRVPWHDRAW